MTTTENPLADLPGYCERHNIVETDGCSWCAVEVLARKSLKLINNTNAETALEIQLCVDVVYADNQRALDLATLKKARQEFDADPYAHWGVLIEAIDPLLDDYNGGAVRWVSPVAVLKLVRHGENGKARLYD